MKNQETITSAERRESVLRVVCVSVFVLCLYVLTVVAFIIPIRPTHSDMEHRDLTAFPTFSWQALADGSYFDNINLWFSDTFPMRDEWMMLNNAVKSVYGITGMNVHGEVGSGDEIPDLPLTTVPPSTTLTTTATTTATSTTTTAKTTTTKATTTTVVTTTTTPPTTTTVPVNPAVKPAGQDKVPAESNGAILTIGDSGFEYYHFSQSAADIYIGAVNRLVEQLDGTATVYDLIVPTSMDICVDPSVRANINASDQQKAIAYFYGSMSGKVKTVNVFDPLLQAHKNGEYLYFRTDHHWTARGAYRAYEQFRLAAGQQPTPLDTYQAIDFPGYLGSFYRDTQSAVMAASPDVVQAFIPPSTNTMTLTTADGSTSYPIVTDVSDWDELYKYNCFIAGDNPLSVIHNPNKTDGSACLLIKESFGNAFAPFLVEDYQTVYVLDYRYFDEVDSRGIAQFVKDNGIQDVLLLNNMSATRNEYLVESLDALVK